MALQWKWVEVKQFGLKCDSSRHVAISESVSQFNRQKALGAIWINMIDDSFVIVSFGQRRIEHVRFQIVLNVLQKTTGSCLFASDHFPFSCLKSNGSWLLHFFSFRRNRICQSIGSLLIRSTSSNQIRTIVGKMREKQTSVWIKSRYPDEPKIIGFFAILFYLLRKVTSYITQVSTWLIFRVHYCPLSDMITAAFY